MKKYGWQAVYLSFFSGDLYRDVAKNWRGVGYIYLLLLVAVLSLFGAITVQLTVNALINDHINPFIAKWPSVTIDNGTLSVAQTSPYVIGGDRYIIDFDTRPDAKFPDGKQGWLVTKSEVLQFEASQDRGAGKQIVDISQLSKSGAPLTIDQDFLKKLVGFVGAFIGLFTFVGNTFRLLFLAMLQSVIIGGIGLAVARSMKVEMTFAQAVRIAVIGLTPGLVLDGLSNIAMHPFGGWANLFFLLAIGYTVFGIRANAATEQTPATDSSVI